MLVHTAAGTLVFPNISVPGGLGSMAAGVEIVGENAVVATGTVSSVVAGTVRSPLMINVAGAQWASISFVGGVGRFLTGALSGTDLGVTNNGTGQLLTTRFVGAAPAPGDTFEIRMNATTLVGGGFETVNSASGDRLKFTRVNINSTAIAQSTLFTFEEVRWLTGSVFFEQNCDVLGGGGAYSVMFVSLFSAALNAGSINATRVALHNIAMQVFRDQVSMQAVQTFGTSRFTVRDDLRLTNFYAPATTLAAGTNVVRNEGGSVALLNATISDVIGDAAIASVGGTGSLEGVQGTGNAVVPVSLKGGAQWVCPDADTGTTITSPSGDVVVGANGAADWADIATNLAINTTDLANANSQMCRIGPLS